MTRSRRVGTPLNDRTNQFYTQALVLSSNRREAQAFLRPVELYGCWLWSSVWRRSSSCSCVTTASC
ncbi:hypothetical protein [Liquorilactobacillus nagelii]